MAKAKAQNGLTKTNKVLSIILIIAIIVTAGIIIFSAADKAPTEGADAPLEDVSVLEAEFAPGNYGGVEFGSIDDVVNYYVEAYDYTKSLTAQYKNEDGSTATFYKMLGEDSLEVTDLLIDGKENGTISNLVPGIVGGIYSNGLNGLSPSYNRDPNLDEANGINLTKCLLVPDDILAANVVDNKDGTITITLQPKMFQMSAPGADCQGHLFNSLGDISGVVSQISVLTWAEGDANSNIMCNYMGGTADITIDTKTKEITKAEYYEVVKIAVTHANVTIIKDKSASLTVKYNAIFPASDEYLKNTKGITRM